MAKIDAAAQPTARDFLAQAFDHATEAAAREPSDGKTHHEERELLSLIYSVATSLASIAEALPPSKMQAGPDTVTDGGGDLWMRVPGSDVYVVAEPRFGETLGEIRKRYGIRGEESA